MKEKAEICVNKELRSGKGALLIITAIIDQ